MTLRAALLVMCAACSAAHEGAGDPVDGAVDGAVDASPDARTFPATLDGARDRLLATYLAYLQANPTQTQSNGLSGATTHDVCQLWMQLAPSGRQVYVTITHRLYGSLLQNGDHALDHVTKLYRLVGGQDASAVAPGSCGGGEYNRVITQIDPTLHAAMLAANTRKGASPYDLGDVTTRSYWRDTHDLAGPHAPFDASDETNDGAPRGQTQYFKDPASTRATSPLGRMDLAGLVEPYALEVDLDYDCTHNSNPACSYTLYGPLCAPESSQTGAQIYTKNYGDAELDYRPAGC